MTRRLGVSGRDTSHDEHRPGHDRGSNDQESTSSEEIRRDEGKPGADGIFNEYTNVDHVGICKGSS